MASPMVHFLRLDSIPSCNGFHTMLCIDSIHAFGVIWRGTVEMFTKLWYNEVKKGGELYMNFSHCDKDEKYLSLHDCVAEQAYFENGKLGFEFNDGFWISPDHPESNLSNLVRTDFSKVEYTLEDGADYDVTVYVFTKNLFKKQSVLNGQFKN